MPQHKLITSGPYAYVRHPGYLGSFLNAIGYVVVLLSPGTVFSECLRTKYPLFSVAWIGLNMLAVVGLSVWLGKRTSEEDKLMRKQFGAEWDLWAKRTTARLVPCVF